MKLSKANSRKRNGSREYEHLNILDIKEIVPRWAYGENVDNLYDISQHPYNANYEIYLVNVKDLIVKTEFYGLNPELLFTGDDASDSRVISILKIWEEKGYIDPPTISINAQHEDKLLIVDGRHRTKLAYLIGAEQIPIAIHKSSVGAVERIIKLNST